MSCMFRCRCGSSPYRIVSITVVVSAAYERLLRLSSYDTRWMLLPMMRVEGLDTMYMEACACLARSNHRQTCELEGREAVEQERRRREAGCTVKRISEALDIGRSVINKSKARQCSRRTLSSIAFSNCTRAFDLRREGYR